MTEPEEGDTPLVESKQIVDSSKEAGVGVGTGIVESMPSISALQVA